MSLSRSLSEYFIKCKQNNWLIRTPPFTFTSLPSSKISELRLEPNTELRSLPKIKGQNDSKLLQENYHLVGKGSNYERKMIHAQIKTLGLPSLKRVQNIEREQYPEEEAKVISHLEDANNNSDASVIHDQINWPTVKKIIETLVEITPKPESTTALSNIELNNPDKKVRSLKRHVYSEIPPLPEFEGDSSKFEDYIFTLTHSTFYYKTSSKFNGIISKILMNLFHPLNSKTSKLRTLDSYNSVLHFYSLKWNIATCREFLLQMKLEAITPNTTTYNIMLKNLLTLQHIQHMSNPYVIASSLLTQMKGRDIKADVVTWNLIFALLRDDHSKTILLRNRSLLNIPLDSHSVNSILRYLVENKDLDSFSLLKLIHKYDFQIDRKLLSIIVKRLVAENHFDAVFKILDFVKDSYDISSEPMNLLLVHFSKIGRVDVIISLMNTFKLKYDVKPDANSYNLVMKSFCRSGDWKKRYEVWRVMYKQMLEDLDGTISGEHWIRHMRAFYKFRKNIDVDLSEPLTESELELKKLKDELNFDNTIPIKLDPSIPEQKAYRNIARDFGYWAFKPKVLNDMLDESFDSNNSHQKHKMKKYKKKIGTLSIQKSMVKRIPYAKDQYSALDAELRERKIIN